MRWFGRRSRRTVQRPRAKFRPQLEALEQRQVPTVLYYGGNLLPQVETQALYYGNEWSSVSADSAQMATLDSFLKDITGGAYLDALRRAGYGVSRGTASAGVLDGALLAPNAVITDASIQERLQADISQGLLSSPDANRLYIVYVEPNVAIDLGAGQGTTQKGILGYHGAFAGHDAAGQAITLRYAVIAYPGGSVGNSRLGTTAIDQLTAVTSHELAEAVTDPDVTFDQLGWYDPSRGEVGDVTENNPTSRVRLDGYLVQEVASQNDQLLPIFPSSNQSLDPTATVLTAPALIQAGQAVTFTVTESPSGGSRRPSGTVTFEEGTKILATATLDANGQATFTTTALPVGSHSITVIYSGEGSFAGNTSAPVTVQVTPPVSPYEAAALGYLSAGCTSGYDAYVYGSHSVYAYEAYLYGVYALAYAQRAANSHSAADWSTAFAYASAAQAAAASAYASSADVYTYYASVYLSYGEAYAHANSAWETV
jgi:hypothetical protein